jgi:hypothetical protein
MRLPAFGFVGGKGPERRLHRANNLDEFAFFPVASDESRIALFDLARICMIVRHCLKHRNYWPQLLDDS